VAENIIVPYLPCLDCQGPTLRAILGQHGGRCIPCYDAYRRSGECGSGESLRTLTHADKLAILARLQQVTRGFAARNAEDPKRWARTLLERAANGEQIPSEHLRMANRALRTYLGSEPESDTALAADMQSRVDTYSRDEYVPGL